MEPHLTSPLVHPQHFLRPNLMIADTRTGLIVLHLCPYCGDSQCGTLKLLSANEPVFISIFKLCFQRVAHIFYASLFQLSQIHLL